MSTLRSLQRQVLAIRTSALAIAEQAEGVLEDLRAHEAGAAPRRRAKPKEPDTFDDDETTTGDRGGTDDGDAQEQRAQ